ncbi:hypothetical protein [uncultured Jannaschia sp.]|uniref:hypothetical protein n=1 Tax=uncultured Jannaschia sp. TaxID=293347 RepID=UPI00260E29EB|nr:hypothetical protein [uncultured Jannaschia sp.]
MFGTRRANQTIGVLAGLLALGVAGWAFLPLSRESPLAATSRPELVKGAQAIEDAGAERPTTRLVLNTLGAPDATPALPPEAATPLLDIVRVDVEGGAVIAGRGGGGSEVTVRFDGNPVATSRADAAGNFASLFDLPMSAAPGLRSRRRTPEGGWRTEMRASSSRP